MKEDIFKIEVITKGLIEGVSSRELYKILSSSGKDYPRWFATNIVGFVEGVDFIEAPSNGGTINHILTIDTAKHICLMSKCANGYKYRQVLIDLEKNRKPLTGIEWAKHRLAVEVAFEQERQLALVKIAKAEKIILPADTMTNHLKSKGYKFTARDINRALLAENLLTLNTYGGSKYAITNKGSRYGMNGKIGNTIQVYWYDKEFDVLMDYLKSEGWEW